TTPGKRPVMVVASTMAGMKNMNVTRACVIGNISQCSAAASRPMMTANARRRGPVFSIQGHRREKRKSVLGVIRMATSDRALGPQGYPLQAQVALFQALISRHRRR